MSNKQNKRDHADRGNVINIETRPPNWLNAVVSTITQRFAGALFGVSKDGKRDISSIYGYQQTLTFQHYYQMYSRGGLAARIINALPRSSWRDGLQLVVDDSPILEDQIKILERFGKLSSKLERADILNRIGRFSVLFVGVPDGLDPDKPIGTARPDRLKEVYFTPYAEDGVTISEWDMEPSSPRYGQPLIYTLQLMHRDDSGQAQLAQPRRVHWSRLVHLAEGLLDNEVEGTPALQAIFNNLEDMNKTVGGAAEAYFRNARNRFAMQTDPKFNGAIDPKVKQELEEEAQRFQNDWQDFIRAGGIQINPLTIPHNDPSGTVHAILQVLSGTTGIPIRILTGEGAGQLAGNEDKESYNQLIQDRKELYCSDWVLSLFGILAAAKMLDLPDTAGVMWKTPDVLSSVEKADTASKKASAFASVATAMSSPAFDAAMPINKALELVFGKEEVTGLDLDAEPMIEDDIEPEAGAPLPPGADPLGLATKAPA